MNTEQIKPNKKHLQKLLFLNIFPTVAVFIAIVVCGVIFKQHFIKMLPVCISLIVLLLQSNANKWCFLIGAVNCIIYSVGFVWLKLYGSVASALLISLPIQLFTFFRWNKNPYKSSTIIKRMSKKQYIIFGAATLTCWVVSFFVLRALNGNNVALDTSLLVTGILASVLMIFAYIESCPINIISQIINVALYLTIVLQNINEITYLLSAFYALFRTVQTLFSWRSLMKRQQAELSAQKLQQNLDIEATAD